MYMSISSLFVIGKSSLSLYQINSHIKFLLTSAITHYRTLIIEMVCKAAQGPRCEIYQYIKS